MSIGVVAGICVALFVAAGAFAHLRGRSTPGSPVGQALRWLVLAGAVGIAVAALPDALADSPVVPSLLAPPVLLALLALIAGGYGKAVVATSSAAALLMLLWGVFLASFLTPYFVFPALALGVAAVASIRPRDARQAAGA
ncbi:hypothetical protein [Saccharothrix xinjiangensis]|uniref:Uncharacterized protein n=1 Tax=Saccharothrix xinjiangensis TaxID=204798 RepID=A0ABV9Y3J7_9PSEU